MRTVAVIGALLTTMVSMAAETATIEPRVKVFLEAHCSGCHDATSKAGGLDLAKLPVNLNDAAVFNTWVKVHDRVKSGEMPPAKRKRPAKADLDRAVQDLATGLTAADLRRKEKDGRPSVRRLNRTEYENTLRDLFGLPGLAVRDLLPDDGRSLGFDKSAAGLEVSHVQMAKYMEAADAALDLAIAATGAPPQVYKERLYPSNQYDLMVLLTGGDAVFLSDGKYDPRFPIVKDQHQDLGKLIENGVFKTGGTVGVFRHQDESFPGRFAEFVALHPGRYKVRLSAWAFQWNKGDVKPALRTEVVALRANGRLVGNFDAPSLVPTVHETEVWLNRGEYLTFNPASLWPVHVYNRKGRAAEFTGPGIALDWLDVEGPLYDRWPPPSQRRLFGDLPLVPLDQLGEASKPSRAAPRLTTPPWGKNGAGQLAWATVHPGDPAAQAEKHFRDFLRRAFRRPVPPEEVCRYTALAMKKLADKASFEDAMRAAYKAALCSPDFLFLRLPGGKMDDWSLASRLSYFLWNTMPDDDLFALAGRGQLHEPATLRAQVERMLKDARSDRFVADFLDQWLDLREIEQTTPDRSLYPEFIPYLQDSMQREPREFFRELLNADAPMANAIHADFAMLNQKLAEHYGIPGVVGSGFRKVNLPAGSHRGGLLTQAAVLKVTANGTVTSPVKRGAWVQKKIVGRPPDPPPPDIAAIEPDVRGAVTVRELLAKHRSNVSCAACHAKMDPPGFALESFDAIGGWRDRYRSLGKGDPPDPLKKLPDFVSVAYRLGPVVDATGEMADGRKFGGIDEYEKLLLSDTRQIARNLTTQLLIYATGEPVGFADRPALERALDRTAGGGFRVRSLIHEVVQSPAFLSH